MRSVYLRAPEPQDLNFLYELENDQKLWPISLTKVPFSRTTLEAYLEQVSRDSIESVGQYRFIIADANHQALGCADLYEYDPIHSRAGVGIVIQEEFRGKGIASLALEQLITYVKNNLHLHQLYAQIGEQNLVSQQLFKSLSFEHTATLKSWRKTHQGFENIQQHQLFL
ncbi:MAG: GNAT family N-acetyltransferase [Flavobacteriaceae bacterium]